MNGQRPIGVSPGESVAVAPARREESAQQPHDIVVAGGGAGGLELATQLGKTLGKRGRGAESPSVEKGRTHLWKPLLHAVAAGSLDPEHELNYLAQAHWHHFRYRLGEMVGLDRARKIASRRDRTTRRGAEITPPRLAAVRHADHRRRQRHQRFRHARRGPNSRCRWRRRSRRAASTAAWSTPASAPRPRRRRSRPASCMSPSSAPARPAPNSPPNCTTQRARSSPIGLDRIDPEKRHQDHLDRGGRPHPARAAAAHFRVGAQAAGRVRRRGRARARG